MKALVPALSLIFGLSWMAVAEEVGSSVSTDDICAVRPDLCGAAALRNKKRKKKARDLDFADFNEGAAKPARPVVKATATREPASTGLLREEDFVPKPSAVTDAVKKKKKKKKNSDALGDFWEREEEQAAGQTEVQLLDVEREEIFNRRPRAVVPRPPARHQISFDDYLNANSILLSGHNAGRQDAFATASRNRGAVIEAPAEAAPVNADQAAAAGANSAVGSGQSLRENQPQPPPANGPPPQ